MEQSPQNMTPIEQLERAARATPPDIALAERALHLISLNIVENPDVSQARRAAELSTNLVETLQGPGEAELTPEQQSFATHANNLTALANILAGPGGAQTEPTPTEGKKMGGAKK